MPINRAGGPVEERAEDVRPAFRVHVQGGWTLVDMAPVQDLGFDYEVGVSDSRAAAHQLYLLGTNLDSSSLPDDPDDPEYAARLDRVLDLREEPGLSAGLEALSNLISISAPRRQELSDDMVRAFRSLSFLSEVPEGDREEPAFTFQTRESAPILWELMYEGELGEELDLDRSWKRFWGFRVPITHWLGLNRTERIVLRGEKGVFSATHADLKLADREVAILTRRMAHGSLASAFRERVAREAPELPACDPETWSEERCRTDTTWLKSFLEQRYPNAALRKSHGNNWKTIKLKEIFGDPHFQYDILHFACHCELSEKTEFLSKLEMTVGGEPVRLEAGLIPALRIKREEGGNTIGPPGTPSWRRDTPGPLVFLNACSSAGSYSPGYRPPGFPKNWIEHRGALAVIGTVCPVPDFFAHAFAQKFYEVLLDSESARNRYLGEALLQTRRYFLDKYANPLGLAYILYAVDGAYVEPKFTANGEPG